MRISRAVLLLALTGCGERQPDVPAKVERPAERPPEGVAERVECALGNAPLTRDCTIDRVGDALILRHPDGGFRRLRIIATGYAAVDGSEPVRTVDAGNDRVVVTVGGAQYRLPAVR